MSVLIRALLARFLRASRDPHSQVFPENPLMKLPLPFQHTEFIKKVETSKPYITEEFCESTNDSCFEVTRILDKIEHSDLTHHYSLACLINAADYNDKSDWMIPLATHFVERAMETASSPEDLDLLYRNNEENARGVFGSEETAWKMFCRLVALLEWKAYPIEFRQDMLEMYVHLVESKSSYQEAFGAVFFYSQLVKWLLPNEHPFQPEGIARAIGKARKSVFAL